MVKCTPTKVWKKYNATTFNFTHTTKHNALNYLKKGIDLSLLKMKGLCLKRMNENGEREREREREIVEEGKGARSSISKEMKVINHTSVVQQSLTGRASFSIVSVEYDNTNYFNYSWCL